MKRTCSGERCGARWLGALALLMLSVPALMGSAAAQLDVSDMVATIADSGWWDEGGTSDAAFMSGLVASNGGDVGFVVSTTGIEVDNAAVNASDLLAQAVLRDLPAGTGMHTVVVDANRELGAASVLYSQLEITEAKKLAETAAGQSSRLTQFVDALSTGAAAQAVGLSTDVVQPVVAQTESALFSPGQWVILGLIVAAMAGIVWTQRRLRSRRREVHTAPARQATSTSLSTTSDLILELEPRVTIADDRALKERFTNASRTYIEVQEQLRTATRGHDIADLRIEMSKANWALEVIEAELDGVAPPKEPHSRDTSGSAWDSTRGRAPRNNE